MENPKPTEREQELAQTPRQQDEESMRGTGGDTDPDREEEEADDDAA